MNNRLFIISILVGLVALGLSIIALLRAGSLERNILNRECQQTLNLCYDRCGLVRSAAWDTLDIREHVARERHLQQLLNCNIITNPDARESCIQSENEAYGRIVNSFMVLKRTLSDRYGNCKEECAAQSKGCKPENKRIASR